MICEHCQSDSGRYNMNLECCRVRHYAKMPEARRKGQDKWLRASLGDVEFNEFVEKARVEWKRLKELKCLAK
jgi:hypothetical protein